MKTATLQQLSELVHGTLLGAGDTVITGASPAQTAEKGFISFLMDRKKSRILQSSNASAFVVPSDFAPENLPAIQTDNVVEAFEKIVLFFHQPVGVTLEGISENALIDPTAQLGANVCIGAGAVIGPNVVLEDNVSIHAGVKILDNTRIGAGTVIFPNAVIYEDCSIGKNCILHANCVLGAYGFGYDSSTGEHILSRQWGNVVLEDRVEVGACTTIDRGTYSATAIGEGTKIDNLVMIAHNCRLGKFNMICAHTGIAGSTTTGDYVVMAGRVGVRDHVHIGTGAVLGAMAGIMADIEEGARVVGIPATPEKQQMRMQIALAKLPEMRKEFQDLQKKVDKILQILNERTD